MAKQTKEQKQLAVIEQMINTARQGVIKSSFLFILWGWLVFAASLSHFGLLWLEFTYPFIPWYAMVLVGVPVHIYYIRNQQNKTASKSYLDTFMGYLWGGMAIPLFFVIFFAVYQQHSPNPYVLLIIGWATFSTGGILKALPLKAAGIVMWLFAGVMFFITSGYQLLLMALAILFGYIIPGYWLKSKENE